MNKRKIIVKTPPGYSVRMERGTEYHIYDKEVNEHGTHLTHEFTYANYFQLDPEYCEDPTINYHRYHNRLVEFVTGSVRWDFSLTRFLLLKLRTTTATESLRLYKFATDNGIRIRRIELYDTGESDLDAIELRKLPVDSVIYNNEVTLSNNSTTCTNIELDIEKISSTTELPTVKKLSTHIDELTPDKLKLFPELEVVNVKYGSEVKEVNLELVKTLRRVEVPNWDIAILNSIKGTFTSVLIKHSNSIDLTQLTERGITEVEVSSCSVHQNKTLTIEK